MILESEWDGPDGSVRVIDFMPERGEAPDVVRIVEGIAGSVRMRSELRLRLGLRRRRAVGAPPRRHDRRGRRSRLGLARVGRRAPRARLRVVRRLHGRGGPAGLVRAHLEPVVRPPAQPGRPARRAGGHRAVLGRLGGAVPLRGPLPRGGRPLAAHAQGAHLRPDRRHRRRRDDLPARAAGRRRATGTTASAGCATRRSPCRRWSRPATPTRPCAWREWLLRAIAGAPGAAADPVRRGR